MLVTIAKIALCLVITALGVVMGGSAVMAVWSPPRELTAKSIRLFGGFGLLCFIVLWVMCRPLCIVGVVIVICFAIFWYFVMYPDRETVSGTITQKWNRPVGKTRHCWAVVLDTGVQLWVMAKTYADLSEGQAVTAVIPRRISEEEDEQPIRPYSITVVH